MHTLCCRCHCCSLPQSMLCLTLLSAALPVGRPDLLAILHCLSHTRPHGLRKKKSSGGLPYVTKLSASSSSSMQLGAGCTNGSHASTHHAGIARRYCNQPLLRCGVSSNRMVLRLRTSLSVLDAYTIAQLDDHMMERSFSFIWRSIWVSVLSNSSQSLCSTDQICLSS